MKPLNSHSAQEVLVTGASGFLGTALVRTLNDRGVHTWAVIRPGANREEFECLEHVECIDCDIQGYQSLRDILPPDTNIGTVFHFAWEATSGPGRADVGLQLANVQASLELVKQAKALGARKFVFAASIMEYEVMQTCLSDRPLAPSQAYCVGKLTADKMCSLLAEELGLSYAAALISNVYGPGELSARFLNTTLLKMQNNKRVPLSSCEQFYDFLYIDDAVAYLLAIGNAETVGGEYYIGNSTQRPLKDFIEEMKEAIGSSSFLGYGEVPSQVLDSVFPHIETSRMEKEFGIAPQVTFGDGVVRTSDWLSRNKAKEDI